MFLTFSEQNVIANIVGAIAISLISAVFGRKAANIGIFVGFAIVAAYFSAYTWPIEMDSIRESLDAMALNVIMYGCYWMVAGRIAAFVGSCVSKMIGSPRAGPQYNTFVDRDGRISAALAPRFI